MNCIICKKTILKYNETLNHLKIDENTSVDICLDCTNKFMKWQQGIYKNLFPTKLSKKKEI